MTKKKFILVGLILSACHYGFSFIFVFIAVGLWESPFPEWIPLERYADRICPILLQPGLSLSTDWMSQHNLEWELTIANSLLWGFAVAALLAWLLKWITRRSHTARV